MVTIQDATKGKAPVSDWVVQDVVEWMSTLSLSKEYPNSVFVPRYRTKYLTCLRYTRDIEQNDLTGQILLLIKGRDDWKEFGFTVDDDLQILCNAVKQLQ